MKKSIYIMALLAGIVANSFGFVFWTNASGNALSFSWSGGGSDLGLFGSPTVFGDSFYFFPSNFRAQSTNGVGAVTYDRLEVTLEAFAGKHITGIQITEYGDYGILSSGSVQVSGTLFMTNLLQPMNPATANLSSNPASPITSGSGAWTASASISGLDWTRVKFIMNNNLQATSAQGSTTFIEKKVGQAGVVVTIIPEPTTAVLLSFGALALLRKRK